VALAAPALDSGLDRAQSDRGKGRLLAVAPQALADGLDRALAGVSVHLGGVARRPVHPGVVVDAAAAAPATGTAVRAERAPGREHERRVVARRHLGRRR